MPDSEKILMQQVSIALLEDVGAGDLTSIAVVPSDKTGAAEIVAKSDGIICGLPLAEYTFLKVDTDLNFQMLTEDGKPFARGDRVAMLSGAYRSILTGERTALNFLGHLSGIATLTHKFVTAIEGTSAKILDTRKTLPGLRYMEKYAVATGGGENHRMGLYDMVLVKDNHIAATGTVRETVAQVREYMQGDEFARKFRRPPEDVEIEVEVETIAQLSEALEAGVKRILLDNTSLDNLRDMVKLVRDRDGGDQVKLEASGNVTLDTVAELASTGVDYISIGALTHSAPSSDFSLKLLQDE
jgi:nicotinate-nucleotide pyrophosphorylase (carboxylating)